MSKSLREIDPADEELPPPPVKPVPVVNADGTPTGAGWKLIGERLRSPMPAKQRKGPGGRQFDYITARQVQARLDAVVGPGNWTSFFVVLDLAERVVMCELKIFGVTKSDVGYSNNPDDEHETEPMKAAFSDAFKRAAVQWGVGRWLYGDG